MESSLKILILHQCTPYIFKISLKQLVCFEKAEKIKNSYSVYNGSINYNVTAHHGWINTLCFNTISAFVNIVSIYAYFEKNGKFTIAGLDYLSLFWLF